MFSVFDQENLANAHQTTAASKPLNQSIRQPQSRTPGANTKTPFRSRNDENKPLHTGKLAQNTFVTPAPRVRAPLGAKTTNSKSQAFQTPAPFNNPNPIQQTAKESVKARRSAKHKVDVVQDEIAKPEQQPSIEDDSEPEFGYAPPPITPLPDPPLDFDYDTTYACLKPENFTCGVGEIYFQSPKDENGFSISLKREEEVYKKSLEDDLAKILQPSASVFSDPDEEVSAILRKGPKAATSARIPQKGPGVKETNANTIQSRAAASKLSHFNSRSGLKLPSAVDRETASSKQKRKPAFVVSRDTNDLQSSNRFPPPSKGTIGFPKAKKPQSIIPKEESTLISNQLASKGGMPNTEQQGIIDQSQISPRKFVELYGEPPFESEMWFRLKELEIRDRRREEAPYNFGHSEDDSIFALDEEVDMDDKLAVMFENDEEEDFEL